MDAPPPDANDPDLAFGTYSVVWACQPGPCGDSAIPPFPSDRVEVSGSGATWSAPVLHIDGNTCVALQQAFAIEPGVTLRPFVACVQSDGRTVTGEVTSVVVGVDHKRVMTAVLL